MAKSRAEQKPNSTSNTLRGPFFFLHLLEKSLSVTCCEIPRSQWRWEERNQEAEIFASAPASSAQRRRFPPWMPHVSSGPIKLPSKLKVKQMEMFYFEQRLVQNCSKWDEAPVPMGVGNGGVCVVAVGGWGVAWWFNPFLIYDICENSKILSQTCQQTSQCRFSYAACLCAKAWQARLTPC